MLLSGIERCVSAETEDVTDGTIEGEEKIDELSRRRARRHHFINTRCCPHPADYKIVLQTE